MRLLPAAATRLAWRRPQPDARAWLAGVLAVAVVVAAGVVDGPAAVHAGGSGALRAIGRSLLAPELSGQFLLTAVQATALTVAYATAGMSLALVVGLPGAVVLGGGFGRRRWMRLASLAPARAVFAFLRSVHELVWALLLVTILGLTPLAGILAIGLPYGATVARVLGERLQDVPDRPLEALRSAGASTLQVLLLGRVPLAAADCVAYLWYRLECAVRSAAVLSFVGLGGIGYRIQIALADLAFDQVWPLLAFLVLLIVGLDRLSGHLRAAVLEAQPAVPHAARRSS